MGLELLSAPERRNLLLSVGTHRGQRPLSPVEVSVLFQKLVDGGTSAADCAAAVHLESTTWVTRFLALSKLPEDIRHLIDWGRGGNDGTISLTSAFELSRLPADADQREAAAAVVQHDFTTAEVRQLVQTRKRSKKSIEECIASVLKMRPEVIRRHVFIGAVLDERVQQRLRELSQQQRDALLANAISQHFPGVPVSGRLGPERFTLVGGDGFGLQIKTRKNVLEGELNASIASGAGDEQ